MPLTIQQITNQSLSILDKALTKQYVEFRVQYHLKYSYGKYKIYKSEYDDNLRRRNTITLAKGLDRATAEGMMKLLKEPTDE